MNLGEVSLMSLPRNTNISVNSLLKTFHKVCRGKDQIPVLLTLLHTSVLICLYREMKEKKGYCQCHKDPDWWAQFHSWLSQPCSTAGAFWIRWHSQTHGNSALLPLWVKRGFPYVHDCTYATELETYQFKYTFETGAMHFSWSRR